MTNRKIKDLSAGSGDDLKKVLQAVEETLRNGSVPEGLVISADEETQKRLDEILSEIVAIHKFALSIADGDLSKDLAVKGHVAGSLKSLQSNLRHLTWQAGQIAGGDLSQRIHFMGEFSDSFNTMVEHLSEDKTNRTHREDELRRVNAALADEVAEHRKTEEALRESRQILEAILNSIPSPIFYKDRNGIYTGCNPAFEGYIGLPKDQLVGRTVYDIAPKDLADIYYTADKELLDNPGSQSYESHVKYADDSIHDVIFNKATITDLKGNVNGLVGVILDITERKKAEEEERLTRERFEILVKIADMRDTSESELSQYVMEAACRMTGSTLAFIGMITSDESVMDIVAWSKSTMKECRVAASPIHFQIDKAGIWADAVRTRKPKIVNDYSAPHHSKKGLPDGHVGITRFLSLPIIDNGKVVMVAAVANKPYDYDDADVTRLTLLMQGVWSNLQRRRAEEALIESEYRFRELFNSMSSGVVVYRAVDKGADFELVDFNHGAEIIENVRKQDVMGKRVTEAFPGVEEFGLLEIFRRVWQTGKSEHYPTSLYRDEQISSWRENYVYRLPSMEIVAIYEDVTKSKQAEEALRQNETMYRTLFEDSPISLWEEDFSYVKNWIDEKKQEGVSDLGKYLKENREDARRCAMMVKVIHINHATIALFGAASSREFCEGLSVIFPAESLDAFCEEIVALSRGETEFEKEIPFCTLQGDKKIVIMKIIVLPGYEETLSRIFVSVIDITQRKNMEEALREANKKLNMLSSITRHDILNMIMIIRSYIELSEEMVDNPKLREYMAIETSAVDTIQKQIEFTRYYQDIGVDEPKWQDTGEIVAEVAEQLDLRGITLDNSLKGVEIFADPLIGKVFYNLIENSIRHGEHVASINFSYSEKDDEIVISYRDNGVGISEIDKKKLFRRGFGKNTGLGLFLSREILSITGITIKETGEQGKGVHFEITVPKVNYRYNDNPSLK
ncbi:MAG: PAS domain S-box protein [Methanomicrobiaceae archaeon]|nr:PAS domain S-box protein [Methanomicrobiaceae archaeon]